MIGDLLGLGSSMVTVPTATTGGNSISSGFNESNAILISPVGIVIPANGAALVGINKIAENTSPLPRDRVFINYSLFSGAAITPDRPDVNRFTPGFEKTFDDNRMSIEARFPFAATIDPNLQLSSGSVVMNDDVVFGNISLIYKALLYQSERVALSGGCQFALPTAPTMSLSSGGSTLLEVENDSFHMMPYFGATFTPNDQFFLQGFFQTDVDTNGNEVRVNPNSQGLRPIGRLYDPTLMFIDINMGYWLYRSEWAWLTGFAPVIEYHHNQSVEHTQSLASNGFMIGSAGNSFSADNVTGGCYFEFGQDTTIALGYTAPIGGVDRQFNGELRVFVNRRFGTPSRAARVGF